MILSESPKINAYHVDCIDFMKDKPDNYYDLAIVDPPYFDKYGTPGYRGTKVSKTGVKRLQTKSTCWKVPEQDYFDELFRVSKEQIIWGCNYYAGVKLPVGRLVWDKINDSSTMSKCELAAVSFGIGVHIYRQMWNGMIKDRDPEDGKMIHESQKPIRLYKFTLKKYAKPGDKILDTHGGSMRTAIACFQMGYELDICEKDKKHFDNGVESFKLLTKQEELWKIK